MVKTKEKHQKSTKVENLISRQKATAVQFSRYETDFFLIFHFLVPILICFFHSIWNRILFHHLIKTHLLFYTQAYRPGLERHTKEE